MSLGLDPSTTTGKIALSVMDTENSTDTIDGYWRDYYEAKIGGTITVKGGKNNGTAGSENGAGNGSGSSDGTAKTGDTGISMWCAAFLISSGGLALLTAYRKKEEEAEA